MAQGRALAGALAGDAGEVIDLALVGVRNLRRRQSQAEVHALRRALLGLGPSGALRPRDPSESTVGYVCAGRSLPAERAATSTPLGTPAPTPAPAAAADPVAAAAPAPSIGAWVIAVPDHANLTWESPLTGPNDDSLGPRFPVTAGLYEPASVTALAVRGLWVREGVVAGVRDEVDLTPFESRVLAAGLLEGGREFAAVSAELAPVAILVAHLGFRVAAAVLASSEVIVSTEEHAEAGRLVGGAERKG